MSEQPHLTTNFARIDNIQLRFRVNPDAIPYRWRFQIGAPNFRIYRVVNNRFEWLE